MAGLVARLRSRLGAMFTLLGLPLLVAGFFVLDDGGAGDSGDGGNGGDDGAGGNDGDDGGSDDDKDLNDAGKRALARERAARRDAEKAWKAEEKRAKELEDRLSKAEGASKSEHEKELEKARKEAADAAGKEATDKANARVVRSAIREVAATRLADPADALLHLDVEEFEVDDDGEVDRKKVTKALDDLLKTKPYLAAKKEAKKPGSADGGARDGSTEADVSPGVGRLRHAYASSSTK